MIGGSIVVLGWMCVPWLSIGKGSEAMVIAARRGVSPYRVAPPYNRWGVDVRCDIWTLCGAFVGVVLGLGIGWALFDSLPIGILFAGAGALIAGRYYRVVASLRAVERHAHDAAEEPYAAAPPALAPQPPEPRH